MPDSRSLSFVQTARLLVRGFRPNALRLYRKHDPADLDLYMSFLERERAKSTFNQKIEHVLNDKLIFPMLMAPWSEFVARNIFYLHDGGLYWSPPVTSSDLPRGDQPLPIVIKPAQSRRARDVHFGSLEGGSVRLNDKKHDLETLPEEFPRDRLFIACEFAQNHPVLQNLYPGATQSIRMLTYFNSLTRRAGIVRAILRIGNAASAPFESGSKGGLTAQIDLETGVLSPAVATSPSSEILDRHPDTGALIAGSLVPNWSLVIEVMRDICNSNPLMEYVGWDIVVTETGFKILEANVRPGHDKLQVYEPLYTDAEFLAFLKHKRVVRRNVGA